LQERNRKGKEFVAMANRRDRSPREHRDTGCEDVILDSIAEGVFTVDSDWRITSFNRAAEKITGTARNEAIGRQCWDVFRASICESACALRETMETGERVVGRQVYVINSAGDRVPISVSTALLRDDAGEIIGGVETFRDLSVEQELRRELERRYTFSDMIGRDDRIQELFAMLPDIAESGSTVLIQGESGTGKELLALAIHGLSSRAGGPMVIVNCGALPDTLLESELFGHKAGAFTDAKRDKPGRFALAEGGTVFLDEIGDISTALQSKLLRVLEDGTYEPLGGTETLTANVRIVSAVELPPLRERKDDIPLLVDHFIAKFNRLRNRDVSGVSSAVMSILMSHDFPGNIRELQNVIEHGFVTCRSGQIGTRHLPTYLKSGAMSAETGRPHSMEDLERQFLVLALERNGGNRLRTASELGIHKTTLWRRMKRLGLLS
jgi:PAS domain S-box-containing protein